MMEQHYLELGMRMRLRRRELSPDPERTGGTLSCLCQSYICCGISKRETQSGYVDPSVRCTPDYP